jgi:cytochrome c553
LTLNKENPVFSAVDNSLRKNEEYKNFGSKLGRLSVEERDLVIKGSETFKAFCSTCHGLDGKGLASKIAPPLMGSKHLVDKEMLLKILMNGLSEPIDGITYPTIMPPLSENNDEYIASVASFIRFQFGVAPPQAPRNPNADKIVILSEEERARLQNRPNKGNFANIFSRPLGGIKVEEVKAIRKDFGNKNAPWTMAELEVRK